MSLFSELKRRNVFRTAAAYLVVSWLIIQIAASLENALNLPAWFDSMIISVLLIGFPIVMLFSWAYEITPEGIKKEKDVVKDESISAVTAKKLNIITLIAVIAAGGMFAYQQLNSGKSSKSEVLVTEPSPLEAQQNTDTESQTNSKNNLKIDNKSVAVLPFANMANNAENEPFTVGLHDDLLTHLSKVSALKVISRTSVMEYKDTTKKIKQIADELGVANILEGGVQRAGNKIRLNVQLIDAETDEHLWAEIYDEELTTDNIFDIQTEISKKIAAALKAQLTEAETASISEKPTNSLEAYEAYLQGRQLMEKRTGSALKEARALFQTAQQLDPNYALAYAGEVYALRLLNEYSDLSVTESIELAKPLIKKALALSPQSAEVHLANAAMLVEEGDYVDAEMAYKKALALNTNLALSYLWYGHMLRIDLGRFDEALAMHRKAAELDPRSPIILENVGWSLRTAGKLTEALAQFESLQRLYPNFPGATNGVAWVNDDLGNYAKAIMAQTQAVNLDKGNMRNRFWLFVHYLNIGDVKAAKNILSKSIELSPDYRRNAYQQALLDMIAGDYEAAVERFNQQLQEKQNSLNAATRNSLATFSVINSNCDVALEQWQKIYPEKFAEDYQPNSTQLITNLNLAWCLQQSGNNEQASKLIKAMSTLEFPTQGGSSISKFSDAALLSLSGKPEQAAQAYAKVIQTRKVFGWYWIDHLPYFAEMRKQPVFIEARKQLMANLAEQRELLKKLQSEDNQ